MSDTFLVGVLVIVGLVLLLALCAAMLFAAGLKIWSSSDDPGIPPERDLSREPSLLPLILIVFFVGAGMLLYFGPGAF